MLQLLLRLPKPRAQTQGTETTCSQCRVTLPYFCSLGRNFPCQAPASVRPLHTVWLLSAYGGGLTLDCSSGWGGHHTLPQQDGEVRFDQFHPILSSGHTKESILTSGQPEDRLSKSKPEHSPAGLANTKLDPTSSRDSASKREESQITWQEKGGKISWW